MGWMGGDEEFYVRFFAPPGVVVEHWLGTFLVAADVWRLLIWVGIGRWWHR